MLAYDLVNTVVLVSLLALVIIAYSFRMLFRGRVHYDRVDKQGGSVLLGKGLMEMAYWAMQPVAKFLVFLGISPNQLSWASLVLGGMAGTAIAYGYFGFGALFATYSAFLDTLDGMVARMMGVASDAGEVLDAAVDRYVEFFFLGGVIIYFRHDVVFLAIALAALAGSYMISYSTAKAEALHIPPPAGIMRRPERAFYLTLGAAVSPIPMPWLDHFLGMQMTVGYPLIFACFFVAVLSNISAIERLWTIGSIMRAKEHTLEAEALAAEEASQQTIAPESQEDLFLSPKSPLK